MTNNYINIKKAIELGNPSWDQLAQQQLIKIAIENFGNSQLVTREGHKFINMCSCSYLGLEFHPKIVQGGIDGLRRAGTLNVPSSRLRIYHALLEEVEIELSDLFNARVITTLSCSVATSGILPLLSSGQFTSGIKPVMIFDKNSHFSIAHIKPICADETQVLTAPHNDIEFVEDQCKKNKVVAYIADGAYSLGGHAPVEELIRLQNKYGLFLYFDDSHSLSIFGEKGRGFVRSYFKDLGRRTIIVSSLGKAFGASGGIIMLDAKTDVTILERFGGPLAWSQCINPAAMGAILASVKIHRSNELKQRQIKLRDNLSYFDHLIKTGNSGVPLPIRVVNLPNADMAAECSHYIFQQGFYTSAIFFPIMARGEAGLRVMCRTNMSKKDIYQFHKAVKDAINLYC